MVDPAGNVTLPRTSLEENAGFVYRYVLCRLLLVPMAGEESKAIIHALCLLTSRFLWSEGMVMWKHCVITYTKGRRKKGAALDCRHQAVPKYRSGLCVSVRACGIDTLKQEQ
jgi:hypothetical protein